MQALEQMTATQQTGAELLRECTSGSRLLVVRLSGCTCAHSHILPSYSDMLGRTSPSLRKLQLQKVWHGITAACVTAAFMTPQLQAHNHTEVMQMRSEHANAVQKRCLSFKITSTVRRTSTRIRRSWHRAIASAHSTRKSSATAR